MTNFNYRWLTRGCYRGCRAATTSLPHRRSAPSSLPLPEAHSPPAPGGQLLHFCRGICCSSSSWGEGGIQVGSSSTVPILHLKQTFQLICSNSIRSWSFQNVGLGGFKLAVAFKDLCNASARYVATAGPVGFGMVSRSVGGLHTELNQSTGVTLLMSRCLTVEPILQCRPRWRSFWSRGARGNGSGHVQPARHHHTCHRPSLIYRWVHTRRIRLKQQL